MVSLQSARTVRAGLSLALLVVGVGACSVDRGGLGAGDASSADAGPIDAHFADAFDSGPVEDLGACTGRELACGADCIDPATDPAHCGSCDPCPVAAHATATCTDSVCGSACETGFVDCDTDPATGCEADTLGDPATCGGCGRPCPTRFGTTARCTGGSCTYDCGGGLSDCDLDAANGCETNTTGDALHCGSCSACPGRASAVASCVDSVCVYACTPGTDDCDGDPSNGCEADLSGPATCGSCANVCSAAPFATAACGPGGTCGFSCDSGREDCDGNAMNGCETDIAADELNCGGCGVPCTGTAGTVATCTSGVCTLTCAGGLLECDGNLANGCEVNPVADPLHCGSCAACASVPGATASCLASACSYGCMTDFRDCDLVAANGCEVDVRTSTANCGGCGTACTPPAHATSHCAARACGFDCIAPFADCDGLAGNGCEADTSADPLHCGTCPNVCPARSRATSTCTASGCGYSCTAPFSDCDGVASNGCESDPGSDPLNCGGCGTLCATPAHATPTCGASGCGYACIAPYEDCDGMASNGCERNTQTDLLNCGTCGVVCATPVNAAPSCAASSCGYTCSVGFSDCDASDANGCERSTLTDILNCGGCSNVCAVRANATTTCAASTCGFTCAAGFADCDTLPATGCESLLASSPTDCGVCGNACSAGRACVAGSCKGWTPVSATGAPSARANHTAVWTGTTMIVWGGESGGTPLGDGSRYTPTTNSWAATASMGAPVARRGHTAVWTGAEMIVWGGVGTAGFLNTGARYNPAMNAWTAMTTMGAPSARSAHTAVWTGTRMIVWGGWISGSGGDAGDGAAYNPATNTWTALSATNAPTDRRWHTGTLAGTRMVEWGGETGGGTVQGDGKRYDTTALTWANVSAASAPASRARQTAVWTGTYLVVWGGDDGDAAGVFGAPRSDGGRYDVAADTWAATASSPLAARARHTAVAAGTTTLIWGGGASAVSAFGDGAAYDPAGAGTWTMLSAAGAPTARQAHTAVWTGTEMIVWGGDSAAGTAIADGARLIP